MATPSPDDILKDEYKKKPSTPYQQNKETFDNLLRAQEKETLKRTEESKRRRKENVINSLEGRQARSFTRLAEDTWVEAYRKYAENPTPQNKAASDSALADFVRATSEYKDITGNTYETNKVDQKYVGTLPKEPKGFDPLRNRPPGGAQTPGDRAKIDGAPDYVPPNYLDNSRWNSNSFMNVNPQDPLSNIYTTGQYKEATVVAFIANENGSIYQNGVGDPVDLNSYVDKVIAEYSNAGKMNELRGLLGRITNGTGELAGLNAAKSMPGSDFVGTDYYTRELVRRAAQGATVANIFKTGEKTKSKFFTLSDFLKSDYSNTFLKNYIAGGGGSGSGSPSKTTSITREVYTPEDLELNIDKFFQAYTGQGATKEDVEYLTKRLNESDPQKTVTTNNGNTSTSVVTGGVSGMEEQSMMREMALKDPNAEGYNKATAYLSYFEKALRAPIELGA